MKWVLMMLVVAAGHVASAQKVTKISNQQLVELLKDSTVQLVDVRTSQEVANGVIAGATNINFYNKTFVSTISKMDKQRPIAIYCAVGGRSASAGSRLKKLGFIKIYDLTGGFSDWKKEGYPVAKQ